MTRAVVTHEGPGTPIVLTVYGAAGEVAAVPMVPKQALELAKDLMERAVANIKRDGQG